MTLWRVLNVARTRFYAWLNGGCSQPWTLRQRRLQHRVYWYHGAAAPWKAVLPTSGKPAPNNCQSSVQISGAGQSSKVYSVPEGDVVNGMMYEQMEYRSSIPILTHTWNTFITGLIMEALTIHPSEPTILARQFLKFKRALGKFYSAK